MPLALNICPELARQSGNALVFAIKERQALYSFIISFMSIAKHWCFTLNNYVEEDLIRLRALCGERGSACYIVFGREIGESGTHHLQGFVSLRKKCRFRAVKALIGSRVHLECARGNPSQASDYCKKDGDFEEFGVLPKGKGHRSDIAIVVESVRKGAKFDQILTENPAVLARYSRFFSDLFLRFGESRTWETTVVVYYGETGIGKTKRAFEEAEAPYVHSGGQWFDGYSGEQHVIFDDFGGSEFKLTYLLKLLDRYPMRVPVKGAFVNWVPKKIWITSNYSPKEWFPNAKDEHVRALLRRLFRVVRFRRLSSILHPPGDFEEENIVDQ